MDGRLTGPVSLGLRGWSSDGFKATLPYVTHHYTIRSAGLRAIHLGFRGVRSGLDSHRPSSIQPREWGGGTSIN